MPQVSADIDIQSTIRRRLDLLSKPALRAVAEALRFGKAGADAHAIAAVIGSPAHREILEWRLTAVEWQLLGLLPVQMGPFQVLTLIRALRRQGFDVEASLGVVENLLVCAAILPISQRRTQAKLSINRTEIRAWAHEIWLEPAPGVEGWVRERVGAEASLQPAEAPTYIYESALPEFRRFAFLMLAEARQKPIRLTSFGTPNKTDLRRVASALGAFGPDGNLQRQSIPSIVYLVLATLLAARLLQAEYSGLTPADEAPAFFTEPPERQAERLFHAWGTCRFDELVSVPTLAMGSESEDPWVRADRAYSQPTDIQITRARAAIVYAISRLIGAQPEAWYRIDELAEFIREQYPDLLFDGGVDDYRLLYDYDRVGRYGEATKRLRYPGVIRRRPAGESLSNPQTALYQDSDWMEVEGAFIRQVLAGPMRYLGLTEVGPGFEKPDRFRLTKIGRAALLGISLLQDEDTPDAGRAVVQPNFEVIVLDAAANFRLLARLDVFAERKSLDRAATYLLTQPAFLRALDQGWSGEEILAELESANRAPLPQNVRYSLEQWLELYLSVTVRSMASVLEVDSPEQLDRMFADSRLQSLLGERLGPATALIPSEHLQEVLAAAQDAGGLRFFDLESERIDAIQIRAPDTIDVSDSADEPFLRYRLGAFADTIESPGDRLSYRMTPETVARAVNYGWTGQQLAMSLEEMSDSDLPAEFLVRLLGWSRAVPALPTEALVAVEAAGDGLDWDLLRKIPAIDVLVRSGLSRTVVLIGAGQMETLRDELALRGIDLQVGPLGGMALNAVIPESALRAALDRYWEGPHAIRQTLQSLGFLAGRTRKRKG